jgi:phage repressor protein C with HTH and peptisase S24 domain/transcriptional regulator with XRE-family HTH domain
VQLTEPLGPKIRKQRRRLGLTLDELAGRTGISKPYLSLIETSRVPNPPSDEKLRRIEQMLGFNTGELLTHAHLQRTPRDVRVMLGRLLSQRKSNGGANAALNHATVADATGDNASVGNTRPSNAIAPNAIAPSANAVGNDSPIDLDAAYVSGVLQELADIAGGNVEKVASNAVPVINRVSAGYPRDFTDLAYPPRVADDYVGCPDLADKDAFAARVHGDSMTPKYREGDIVIFSPASPPRTGDDCFVRFADGQTTFKRIFFETDAANPIPVIRLQPRNERYRPMVVGSDQVSGLYRAVYRYQKVDED